MLRLLLELEPLDMLRLLLELELLDTLRLLLELELLDTLRLLLELEPLDTLRLLLELEPLDTLRLLLLELEPLDTLRLLLELEPLDTLRLLLLELVPVVLRDTLLVPVDPLLVEPDMLRLELVLLGRSYVLPDTVPVEFPLTERDALERLDVAGATLRTDVELRVPVDCDTLRLELVPDTLLDETELAAGSDTRESTRLVVADAVETLRLLLEPDSDVRLAVLRLRSRSHPPALSSRFGL